MKQWGRRVIRALYDYGCYSVVPRGAKRAPGTQMPHLNPGLGQVDLQSHLLAGVDIRVLGLGKQRLQFLQLAPGKGGPLPPLLPRGAWQEQDKGTLGWPGPFSSARSLLPLAWGPGVCTIPGSCYLGVYLPRPRPAPLLPWEWGPSLPVTLGLVLHPRRTGFSLVRWCMICFCLLSKSS